MVSLVNFNVRCLMIKSWSITKGLGKCCLNASYILNSIYLKLRESLLQLKSHSFGRVDKSTKVSRDS